MDPTASNYQPWANVDDGSCIPGVHGCMDSDAFNFDPRTNIDAGGCMPVVYGCTKEQTDDGYPTSNYDARANTDDGSCKARIDGCTDANAANYLVPTTPLLLSRGRPTHSTSQFTSDTGPEKAVDGDLRRWWPNVFQAGGNGGYQTWMVHLAYKTPSPTVRIYLRDCCVADFDGELQVHFGATPDLADARLCQQLRNLGAGTDVDVACDGQGKYVFVSSFGWMAFAEVEVTGIPDLPANNDDGSCVYATAACPAL